MEPAAMLRHHLDYRRQAQERSMGARRAGRYEQDESNDDSEQMVVNVTDEVVRFEIATRSGSPPRRYVLQPFGKSGSSASIEAGYASPYKGQGGGMVDATIETMTEREAYPGERGNPDKDGRPSWRVHPGKRLPRVVHADKAESARAAWVAAVKQRNTSGPQRIVLTSDDGQQVEAMVAPQKSHVEDVDDLSVPEEAVIPSGQPAPTSQAAVNNGKNRKA